MRVEGLDMDSAISAARSLPYLYVTGLNNDVYSSSLDQTGADRLLQENNYRSTDLYTITQNLDLEDVDHRRMVLNLLQQGDLMTILSLLTKDELINGLVYFDKTRLLSLMQYLPQQYLIKMLMTAYTIDDLVKLMPVQEMINIMHAPQVDNNAMVKAFSKMEPRFLKFLMSKILGKNVDGLKFNEMLDILGKTKKRKILDGMKFMPYNALIPFMSTLMKNDPSLLNEMSTGFVFDRFDDLPKADLINTFQALPKDMILNRFIGNLNPQFMVEVATQIDQTQLAQYLMQDQPNLLYYLAGMSAA